MNEAQPLPDAGCNSKDVIDLDTIDPAVINSDVIMRSLNRERQARKQAERLLEDRSRELYTARQEIEQQYQSLMLTQSQLVHAEKMASIGQLAAGIAHEINNPIGFVTSNLQTLQDYSRVFLELLNLYQQLDNACATTDAGEIVRLRQAIADLRDREDPDYIMDDLGSLLDESQDGLKRVREIVQNLKSFVHLGDTEEQFADLNENIEATLKVVWNELKYKCRVEKQLASIPRIRCFASELNQVFMNLLVNAAQAIEDQGVITISTESTDQEVIVRISDTGCGISEDVRRKLFTPFFTTKPVGKGTGLGLSISWGIVKKHRGTIEVDSEPGQGTTFSIRLPMSEPQSGGNDSESRCVTGVADDN
ncbi:MAG: ATP-binding protein [Planctomycetaceae bacterium]